MSAAEPARQPLAQCRICDTTLAGLPRLGVPEVMQGTYQLFDYVRCVSCGCLQIDLIPDNLSRFYEPGYYSYGSTAKGASRAFVARLRDRSSALGRPLLGRPLAAAVPDRKLQALRGLDLTRRTSVLDVGSGSGGMLLALRAIGIDDVLGVDPFLPEDKQLNNGVRVAAVPLDRIDRADWDIITFNHSLEHIPDQVAIIESALARLAPGGTIVVRVPTCDSAAFEQYGADWVQIDAPRHIYLHSRQSLSLTAKRAGGRVVRLVDDSDEYQFWGSAHCRSLTGPTSRRLEDTRKSLPGRSIALMRLRAWLRNRRGEGDQVVAYIKTA
ncbi:MAG: class I SAM-dependent methyltransferase [Acidimicrobiia bacterium]